MMHVCKSFEAKASPCGVGKFRPSRCFRRSSSHFPIMCSEEYCRPNLVAWSEMERIRLHGCRRKVPWGCLRCISLNKMDRSSARGCSSKMSLGAKPSQAKPSSEE